MIDQLRINLKANLPITVLNIPSGDDWKCFDQIAELVWDIGEESKAKDAQNNKAKFRCLTWDLSQGMREIVKTDTGSIDIVPADLYDVGEEDPILKLLDWLATDSDFAGVFIIRDLHHFLSGQRQDLQVCRRVYDLGHILQNTMRRIILMGQNVEVSDELWSQVEFVKEELPSAEYIAELLGAFTDSLVEVYAADNIELVINLSESDREFMVRCAQGLSEIEIYKAFKASVISRRKIDRETSEAFNLRKSEKLRRLGVEILNPPKTQVGGLDNLKQWVKARSKMICGDYSSTRFKNLPAPKGLLLVGFPGCGKSYFASAIGAELGLKVISVDMGNLFGSMVGESERNLRELLATAESIAPCVLMLDELEKAFSGMATGHQGDGGVGRRMFGSFLTWLNNKTAPVFVVATANNISGLPPEFLRKGRFDEIFFVDLPDTAARVEILNIHLANYGVELPVDDIGLIAEATNNWSGSELAELVLSVVYQCEFDDTNPTQADFILAIPATNTTASGNPELIKNMREWAAVSARPASGGKVNTKANTKAITAPTATTKSKKQSLVL